MRHPEAKPLYLFAPVPLRITLAGKALQVERPDRAPVFYPLLRIARIVVGGEGAEWGKGAIEACLEFGIPIVFAPQRWLKGWAVPSHRRQGPLARSVLEGMQTRTERDGIEGWQRSEERRSLLGLLEDMGVDPATLDLRPEACWAWAVAAIGQGGCATRRNLEILEPFLIARLAERLGDAGAPPEALYTGRENGLVRRMWHILRWDLLRLMLEARQPASTPLQPHEAARTFEAWRLTLDRRIEDLIDSLDQALEYIEHFRP